MPRLSPGQLSPDQLALYQRIAAGPRASGPQAFALTDPAGALNGPFNAMLTSPPIGAALQELGSALRYRCVLSARVRELAILLVAAHWDSAFERHAHEAVGRAAGLSEAEIVAVRAGRVPDGLDPAEAAACTLVCDLLSHDDLDDQRYTRAQAVLGDQVLFELTTLVGYYATLALQLRVFRVGVPGPDDSPERSPDDSTA